MVFSSVKVLRQKGRATVSKLFYLINLDSRQSGLANDSGVGNVKRVKERDFAIAKCWRKCSKSPNRNAANVENILECKQTFSVCITPDAES